MNQTSSDLVVHQHPAPKETADATPPTIGTAGSRWNPLMVICRDYNDCSIGIYTMFIVVIAFVLFRADTTVQGIEFIGAMFSLNKAGPVAATSQIGRAHV